MWKTNNLPLQVATFCEEHTTELWDELSPLIKTYNADFRIDFPGKIKKAIKDKKKEIF